MNKITYSRTVNLGDFNSERIEYSVEYEAGSVDKDMVFTEVKETVMGWIEIKEQKPNVTTANTKASAPSQGNDNPWCDEHDRDFFKTKNMRSYAHPLESGGWHNMD